MNYAHIYEWNFRIFVVVAGTFRSGTAGIDPADPRELIQRFLLICAQMIARGVLYVNLAKEFIVCYVRDLFTLAVLKLLLMRT